MCEREECFNCRLWDAEVVYGNGDPVEGIKYGECREHGKTTDFDDWCKFFEPRKGKEDGND